MKWLTNLVKAVTSFWKVAEHEIDDLKKDRSLKGIMQSVEDVATEAIKDVEIIKDA